MNICVKNVCRKITTHPVSQRELINFLFFFVNYFFYFIAPVSVNPAGVTPSSVCLEKRGLHEAPGKSAKISGTKVCPYSHPSSQNSSGSSVVNPLSTSADLCKTTPKHFKTMCRRPTPPGDIGRL